jgi:2-polyprenyl-6-methoxyphenol hydroxylase-like FAD-dependent oxidoreductase
MSLPDTTTVLIVGAGPTGLATALSLLQHGFHDFVIVDAVLQGENTSRALVIHSATMEALDTIGCGDDIASQGTKATEFVVGTRSEVLIMPNFEGLKQHTRRPYVIIVPQNLTEHVLEEKLASSGVTVHRPLKVVGLKRNEANSQLSDVTFEDGKVITAKYVVGADGARSVVRTTAGIGFSDPKSGKGDNVTNLAQMVLADVTFEGIEDIGNLGFRGTVSPDSFFLCVALPSSFNEYLTGNGHPAIPETLYRIGCGVPLEDGEIPSSPPKEYLQKLIDRFGPHKLSSDSSKNPNGKPTSIKDVVWSTRFRTRSAIADKTFTRLGSGESSAPGEGGAIILVGDAAHIHSPAGGQGMNLGLRDAIFLGEALTKHIKAAESKPLAEADAILSEFAAARHARALEVIGLTKRLLSFAGMNYRDRMYWWLPISCGKFRDWALWLLGGIPLVRKKIAWELSGLGRR